MCHRQSGDCLGIIRLSPLFSQISFLNMLSGVEVNSAGEMVFPCLTRLLILLIILFSRLFRQLFLFF